MKRAVLIVFLFLIVVGASVAQSKRHLRAAAADTSAAAMQEIRAFNSKFTAAHQNMDTDGILAMWADDGVTLLPGVAPVQGKENITKFMRDAVAKMSGYKVVNQQDDFHDIRVSGDWASEWADTLQVVHPPDGKQDMQIKGKMALVLHRDTSGWKIVQETWNGY